MVFSAVATRVWLSLLAVPAEAPAESPFAAAAVAAKNIVLTPLAGIETKVDESVSMRSALCVLAGIRRLLGEEGAEDLLLPWALECVSASDYTRARRFALCQLTRAVMSGTLDMGVGKAVLGAVPSWQESLPISVEYGLGWMAFESNRYEEARVWFERCARHPISATPAYADYALDAKRGIMLTRVLAGQLTEAEILSRGGTTWISCSDC